MKKLIIGIMIFALIMCIFKPINVKAETCGSSEVALQKAYAQIQERDSLQSANIGTVSDYTLAFTVDQTISTTDQTIDKTYYYFTRNDIKTGYYLGEESGKKYVYQVFEPLTEATVTFLNIAFDSTNQEYSATAWGYNAGQDKPNAIYNNDNYNWTNYVNFVNYVPINDSFDDAVANFDYHTGLNENGSTYEHAYINTLGYPLNIQVDVGLINRGNNEMDITWENPILYQVPNFGGVDMTQTKVEIGVGFFYKPLNSSDTWVDMSNLTGIPVLDTALDIITLPLQYKSGGRYAMIGNDFGSIGNQKEYLVDYLVLESVGSNTIPVNYCEENGKYTVNIRDAFVNHSEFIANNFENPQDGWDVVQGFRNSTFEFMFVTLRYYNTLSDGSIIYGDTAYHWFDGTTDAYIQDIVLPDENRGTEKVRSMVQKTIDVVNEQIANGEINVDVSMDEWDEWLTSLPTLLANLMKGILALIKTVAVIPQAIGSLFSFLPYEVNALIKFGMFFLVVGGVIKWLKS